MITAKICEILFETGSYNEGEAELFSVSSGKNPVTDSYYGQLRFI